MAPNSAKHTLYKSWKRAKTEEFDSLSKDSCLVRGMQSCPVDLVWRGLYHIYIYIYIYLRRWFADFASEKMIPWVAEKFSEDSILGHMEHFA